MKLVDNISLQNHNVVASAALLQCNLFIFSVGGGRAFLEQYIFEII